MEGIIIYLTERLQNPFSTLFIILMIKLSKSIYFYIFYFLAFIQENNYLYGMDVIVVTDKIISKISYPTVQKIINVENQSKKCNSHWRFQHL